MKTTYTALRALLGQNSETGRTVLVRVDNKLLMVTADQIWNDQLGTIVAYRWQLTDLMAAGLAMGDAIRCLLSELDG
jgi:putative aminopeptidase FrvX